MKILAFEFSSAQRSVAAVRSRFGGDEPGEPGVRATADRSETHRNRAADLEVSEVVETGVGAARSLAMTDKVLRRAQWAAEQIDGLAVGIGPGSYNGIRAAIALAQGWQLARGVKLIGISSAECLAAQAQADGLTGRVSLVIDAQRGEFYLASYELGAKEYREIKPLRLATPMEVREREQAGEVLIGPEVTRWFPAGRLLFPRAAMLGRLALGRDSFVSGEKLEPLYLRETQFVKAPPSRTLH